MQAWWKVRIWDQNGQASPWSEPARWSMGLLEASDWKGKWIGETELSPEQRTWKASHNGYHSGFVDHADAEKWVQIDLGKPTTINAVRLYPARPFDWSGDDPDFMFPYRFKVLVANQADLSDAKTVIDRTESDVPNPQGQPQTYEFEPVEGQYVRLVATKLRKRDRDNHGLSFAEMEVLSGEQNVAVGKKVTATDSVEHNSWGRRRLVDGDCHSHPAGGMDPLTPPRLRKEFAVEEQSEITRAVVYVTALGLYELHINGQRVGDHQLAPEWTDYRQRVQYQTYDVQGLLHGGENAIGVQLADGWYAGRIGLTRVVPDGPPRAIYGRQPLLLLQLELHHADGKIERIVSDGSWRMTTDGPLRTADIMDGVVYDAQRETPGWTESGFDDSAWQVAGVAKSPAVELDAQMYEPIRKTREIRPIAITEPKPGVFVFDMGQNFAGWCRLKVQGEAGQEITLRHGEVLRLDDGTVYTDNLGVDVAVDHFTLRGEGVETFEPHFTYHGFRFVQVTGLTHEPNLDTLTGCVVHSNPPEVGEFDCSSPMINRLWQNILWTQRANMYGVPTDCPQRVERLGWTGDILAFAPTGCFNMDMAAFLSKWLVDMRDAQVDDGRYPDFAPHPYDPSLRFSGVAAWGDAGVFVPWCAYRNYDDERMLAEHYESARRWVDWIHSRNPELLWKNDRHNDYGDWLNANTIELEGWPKTGGEMPKEAFATAFFARSTQIVADMAKVLGRNDDARRYGELARKIRAAFVEAYVEPDGRLQGDTQAGYALALEFNLLPQAQWAGAAQRMVDCFKRYKGQISTGFHSTVPLMHSLTRFGYLNDAYRLVNNREVPSWGYEMDHGATTVWERWDAYVEGRGYRVGMNSFSHYAIGAVGEWMYETMVGINLDPHVPAYKHFVLRPQPGGGLTFVHGAYDSIHGRIASAWHHEGDKLSLEFTVPPNTTATAYLPTHDIGSVHENGVALSDIPGVSDVHATDDGVVCELQAGTYCFELDAASGL